jgi:hypothetical protein
MAEPWTGQSVIGPHHKKIWQAECDPDVGVSTILTFDVGPHTSGWLKNSDYEMCWHLSICGAEFKDGRFVKNVDLPDSEIRRMAREFFESKVHMLWNEPPASPLDLYRTAPQSRYTTHLRLFVDREGHPIIPEGEVYKLKPFDDGSSPEKVFR